MSKEELLVGKYDPAIASGKVSTVPVSRFSPTVSTIHAAADEVGRDPPSLCRMMLKLHLFET